MFKAVKELTSSDEKERDRLASKKMSVDLSRKHSIQPLEPSTRDKTS